GKDPFNSSHWIGEMAKWSSRDSSTPACCTSKPAHSSRLPLATLWPGLRARTGDPLDVRLVPGDNNGTYQFPPINEAFPGNITVECCLLIMSVPGTDRGSGTRFGIR